MTSQSNLAAIVFVVLVVTALVPWAVAFFVQQRLPPHLRGLWPSAIRALSAAARDTSDPFHRSVRLYRGSLLAFVAMLGLALVAWLFVAKA